MDEIEELLWDFLRGVRQGSYRDDPDLVKGCKNKVEELMAASMPQSRTLEVRESVEERIDTSKEVIAQMREELTNPEGSDNVKTSPPPLANPPPYIKEPRERAATTKSKASISDFRVEQKQIQSKTNLPKPPTRGDFFIWFPFGEFGDISVSDGILRFFLEASSPAGNPLACNLEPKQVAMWYVHKLSLDAFSRYTPKGHTRGVKAFWANLGKWSTSGLVELEEAATWCRRVGTANAVKAKKLDAELQEKLKEERRAFKGPDIAWEEF